MQCSQVQEQVRQQDSELGGITHTSPDAISTRAALLLHAAGAAGNRPEVADKHEFLVCCEEVAFGSLLCADAAKIKQLEPYLIVHPLVMQKLEPPAW